MAHFVSLVFYGSPAVLLGQVLAGNCIRLFPIIYHVYGNWLSDRPTSRNVRRVPTKNMDDALR